MMIDLSGLMFTVPENYFLFLLCIPHYQLHLHYSMRRVKVQLQIQEVWDFRPAYLLICVCYIIFHETLNKLSSWLYYFPEPTKTEVQELENLGFMEDVSDSLTNLLSSPSKEIKCVESIVFSSFNPPPSYRRFVLSSHLWYSRSHL